MLRTRWSALLILFAVLPACAQPRQTAPVVPGQATEMPIAGTYQFQMNYNDPAARRVELVSGTIVIEQQQGRYTGQISATGMTPYPITNVNFANQDLVIQARTSEGTITLGLTFLGDSFNGYWEDTTRLRHPIRGSRR
jgi:hypothetical protein